MKRVLKLLTLVQIFCSSSYGQDSIVVFQKNESLFSNEYIFYSNGTFKHYYETDDFQTWYGKGKFKDKGRKRILTFGDPDLSYKKDYGKLHYESNFERTLKIRRRQFISRDYYFNSRKRNVIFVERKTL